MKTAAIPVTFGIGGPAIGIAVVNGDTLSVTVTDDGVNTSLRSKNQGEWSIYSAGGAVVSSIDLTNWDWVKPEFHPDYDHACSDEH